MAWLNYWKRKYVSKLKKKYREIPAKIAVQFLAKMQRMPEAFLEESWDVRNSSEGICRRILEVIFGGFLEEIDGAMFMRNLRRNPWRKISVFLNRKKKSGKKRENFERTMLKAREILENISEILETIFGEVLAGLLAKTFQKRLRFWRNPRKYF